MDRVDKMDTMDTTFEIMRDIDGRGATVRRYVGKRFICAVHWDSTEAAEFGVEIERLKREKEQCLERNKRRRGWPDEVVLQVFCLAVLGLVLLVSWAFRCFCHGFAIVK